MGHCDWVFANDQDRAYHDMEWGIPVHNDDRQMFEHLTLECLQCGLSWGLMMKKREIFRRCFENFDYDKIAGYGEADVERILNTEGMLKSERKVRAVINNAICYQRIRHELLTSTSLFCSKVILLGDFFIIVMLRGVFFAVFSSRILCYTQRHLCSI